MRRLWLLVFEMLHRIRDVDPAAVAAGSLQRAVEHVASRADEGTARADFLVPGLLADQHQRRVRWTFAEYRLGGVLP
jgi:hypothetical protein